MSTMAIQNAPRATPILLRIRGLILVFKVSHDRVQLLDVAIEVKSLSFDTFQTGRPQAQLSLQNTVENFVLKRGVFSSTVDSCINIIVHLGVDYVLARYDFAASTIVWCILPAKAMQH